ncbi:MAG: glutamine--tRNA ligase, partial [bacterium]
GFDTDPLTGEVTTVRAQVDLDSRGGVSKDARKVKATIHWVSAAHAVDAVVRLYDRLFTIENPSGDDWLEHLNPHSLETITGAKLEPSLAAAAPESRWQFERMGYFAADPIDSRPGAPVFNRTVTLRDTWAKIQQRGNR